MPQRTYFVAMAKRGVSRWFLAWTMLATQLSCETKPSGEPSSTGTEKTHARAVTEGSAPERSEPFALTPAQRRGVAANERLAAKLRKNAYDFFRFQHEAFTKEVCRKFEDERHRMPLVNLHGDAHLEQYATTQLGFGLNDFDEAGFGPATVDLLRFGVSIALACRDAEFTCESEAAVQVFLAAYRRSTLIPALPQSAPAWVRRSRATPSSAREDYLEFAERSMKPIGEAALDTIQRSWEEMSTMLRTTGFIASDGYFQPVRLGKIELGIGSALVEKYLLRIEGPSPTPDDDRIVEIKRHDNAERTGCVFHPPTGGVLYPQVMQRRLGRISPEILAYLPAEGLAKSGAPQTYMFWVQSWDPDYQELDREDLASQAELEEIAHDVGLQLGRGHCSHVTAPLEAQHRFAHEASIGRLEARIVDTVRDLETIVYRAWKKARTRL